MDLDTLALFTRDALWLALKLSLPVLGAAFLVALVSAALQVLTQLQDAVLSHVPRLLAVAAVLALLGAGLGDELLSYTRALWAHIPELGR